MLLGGSGFCAPPQQAGGRGESALIVTALMTEPPTGGWRVRSGRFSRRPSQIGCAAQRCGTVYEIGTLGLRLCSSRSSASHRCGRKPAISAGDQQAAVCCKGVSCDQPQQPSCPPEAPGRRRWEDSREGQGQPLLDCLNLILTKSEHLHHGRSHDTGAVQTRPVTAPCVPASDLRNSGRRLKTRNENGPLLLTQTRQVRESGTAGGGNQTWLHSSRPPTLTRVWSLDRPAPRWAG